MAVANRGRGERFYGSSGTASPAAVTEVTGRPEPPGRAAPESFDVAVVGAGFAGTVVAAQLARLAPRPLRVALFDRSGVFGRGAAYGPKSDHCLLNVRAKAMGAFPDAEGDFVGWLQSIGYASGDRELGDRFLPRRLYGEYLCSLLERCAASGMVLERRAACIEEIAPQGDGYALRTPCASEVRARTVVLAIGNLPPGGLGDATLAAAMANHARNAWDVLAREPVAPDADVLIVGTGLSALDVLAHLAANRHRGRIAMISRHGRFPLAHAAPSSRPALALAPLTGAPREVVRELRRIAAEATRDERTWHEVIDALRPQINAIWQSWTIDEQRRFLRHLAPLWEVHRHRAPPAALAVRDALARAGQLHVYRGRLRAITPAGDRLRVSYASRDCPAEAVIDADLLVDCTGPRRDFANSNDALIEALFARDLAAPGPLGMGLAAAPDGTLGHAVGRPPIYALGTPLRGTLCESSAVREIRVQARTIAESIVGGMRRAYEAAS